MDYKKSRDLAWELLKRNNIRTLPIDVKKICENEGISVFSYEEGRELINDNSFIAHTIDNDAFSFNKYILYDDKMPEKRQRFSIAHELGHILLHAKPEGLATVYNREISPCDDPIEVEANIFASRLLAPLCVLQFININTAKEISDYCDISYTAAKLRLERLYAIRKRNSKRLSEKKHGTFLISNLERAVIENFKEYIEANKIERNPEKS